MISHCHVERSVHKFSVGKQEESVMFNMTKVSISKLFFNVLVKLSGGLLLLNHKQTKKDTMEIWLPSWVQV